MRRALIVCCLVVEFSACVEPVTRYACSTDRSCLSGKVCCADGFCAETCEANGGGGGAATGGGSGGGGGGGADAGCAGMEAEYLLAVDQARMCNPNSLVNPCTETQPMVIVCGCPTFINAGSGGPLVALNGRFLDAGCVPMACPRCSVIDGGSCMPISGSPSQGTCVDQ